MASAFWLQTRLRGACRCSRGMIDLDVISNNIANTDTTGFKSSRAEFGDIYSSTAYNLSTVGVGGGTQLQETAQEFSQGDIETTGNSLDVAIDGDGFFTLNTGNGYVYSRAGDFQMDSNGDVVSADGYKLQVYPSGATSGTFDTSRMVDLNLDTSESTASATTSATIIANLPSSATTITGTFSSGDSSTYNDTTSFTAYDSQGEEHTVTVYYTKTATNSWDAHVSIDLHRSVYRHVTDPDRNRAVSEPQYCPAGRHRAGSAP